MRQQQHYGTRKVELAKLSDDDIKVVLFFRPGARNDPSYRRISQAVIEYCKDVQAQMDDIKGRQPTHALEPTQQHHQFLLLVLILGFFILPTTLLTTLLKLQPNPVLTMSPLPPLTTTTTLCDKLP